MGCSGKKEAKLVPVKGTLKIDGKPAGDIMVQFVPKTIDENLVAPTSQALTDASGNFELVTLKNEPGAVEGLHLVKLFDTLEERVPQGQKSTKKPRLAPKFALQGIQVEVKADEDVALEATGPK